MGAITRRSQTRAPGTVSALFGEAGGGHRDGSEEAVGGIARGVRGGGALLREHFGQLVGTSPQAYRRSFKVG